MLCFVHRISFIHTAVTNLDSKSIQASVPVGPDAKIPILRAPSIRHRLLIMTLLISWFCDQAIILHTLYILLTTTARYYGTCVTLLFQKFRTPVITHGCCKTLTSSTLPGYRVKGQLVFSPKIQIPTFY